MAISFIGATDVNPSTAGTSVVLDVPAGVVDNDLLIVSFQVANATVPTLPSGWNVLHTASATGIGFWNYWRIASSEPSSYTFTLPVSARNAASMTAFRGVDTTTPEDVVSAHATANTTTQAAFPAITPLTPGAWILGLGGHVTGSGNITAAWSSTNLTTVADSTSTSAATTNVTGGVGYYSAWDERNGAFTPDMSSTLTTARSISISVVLKPAVPAVGPPVSTIPGDFTDSYEWFLDGAIGTADSVTVTSGQTVTTTLSYSLADGSRVYLRPTALPTTGDLYIALDIYGSSFGWEWRFNAGTNTIIAASSSGQSVSVAWDSAKPYLSMRHKSGLQVSFERGPDGVSGWEEIVAVGATEWASPVKLIFYTVGGTATVANVNGTSGGAPTGTHMQMYTGASWASKPMQMWNGSAWVDKPMSRWTGSAWQAVP